MAFTLLCPKTLRGTCPTLTVHVPLSRPPLRVRVAVVVGWRWTGGGGTEDPSQGAGETVGGGLFGN